MAYNHILKIADDLSIRDGGLLFYWTNSSNGTESSQLGALLLNRVGFSFSLCQPQMIFWWTLFLHIEMGFGERECTAENQSLGLFRRPRSIMSSIMCQINRQRCRHNLVRMDVWIARARATHFSFYGRFNNKMIDASHVRQVVVLVDLGTNWMCKTRRNAASLRLYKLRDATSSPITSA